MKVVFSFQNNNFSKPQKRELTFEKGLTSKMAREMKAADILEISNRFEQKGIPTYFDKDRALAWLCDKTRVLWEQVGQYRTNISSPSGIFGIKFKHLNIDEPDAYGFCNLTPSALLKGSDQIIPSRTVFFNTEYDWSHIDEMMDSDYASKHSSTDFFLYPLLHENAHVAHEEHLLENFDDETVFRKILSAKDPEQIREYRRKYGGRISKLCNYALKDPLEAVACDMPVRIVDAMDKENLTLMRNPFIGTPYEQDIVGSEHSNKERPLQEILRHFWNGRFE